MRRKRETIKQGILYMTQPQQVSQSGDNTAPLISSTSSGEEPIPLSIPITLVLNTVGLSMMNSKDSKRETNRSGYEVTLKEYKPEVIQKLVIQDCLNRIDISLDDVIAHRRDIIDFSKLILFSLFYKQFRRDVFELTVRSPLIKQWNRMHPRQQIDASSVQSLVKMENLLASRQKEVSEFRQSMINKLWNDHGYLFQGNEDKRKLLGVAEKLLKNFHPLTQTVLLDYWKLEDVKLLSQNIMNRIVLFIKRFSLPEFNALVLLEYLQCSERENLIAQYGKLLKYSGRRVAEYPMNEQIRNELIARKISPQTRFSFLFESRNSQSRGKINRLRMMVFSGEEEVRAVNDILFHRSSSDRHKKSIKDYLEQQGSAAGDSFNPEILHYYMNHLEEECRGTECGFSSFVNYEANNSISLTHLIFDC
jgi:hypothetical protein